MSGSSSNRRREQIFEPWSLERGEDVAAKDCARSVQPARWSGPAERARRRHPTGQPTGGYNRGVFLVEMTAPAAYLGVSKAFLERDRWAGARIPFVRIGSRAVRYRQSDLDQYIQAQLRRSTSDPGRAA